MGVVDSHTLGQAEIVFEICLSLGGKQVQWAHGLELGNNIKMGSYLSFSTAFCFFIWSSDRFHFGFVSQNRDKLIKTSQVLCYRSLCKLQETGSHNSVWTSILPVLLILFEGKKYILLESALYSYQWFITVQNAERCSES